MTNLHGFELVQEQYIDELKTKAQLYRHIKTGARLLSLQNDDENKVFGITFRTPPNDSTGVPHIMEHAVLGGSRKYPVKEPFVELIKGSLKTFVNAMTAPDKTMYPVASTNMQDFYNLVDVYLDAVFYPLITPHHLDQEGWHYELENEDDPLVYKGVVFNEMKGAYSSPDMLMYRHSQRSLFPDTTYGVDSGGDPTVIPELTYEQFKSFHESYYHPSNSYIYFYGDDDPEERLRLLDAYLRNFDAAEIDSDVEFQKPFTQALRLEIPYGVDDADAEENKSQLRINWLLPENADPAFEMTMDILSYAILGTPASPLRKTLTDSGLGEDVLGGYSSTTRQPTFSVGMKGIEAENVERVETLILESISALAEEGIEREMLESAINTIEFELRENNTGSYPRGLALMMYALGNWVHGHDPLQVLAYAEPLAKAKERILNEPEYLQDLMHELLINNHHRTTVVLQPDAELRQREEAAEKARLEEARLAMSAEELQQIIRNTQALKERQQTPDRPEDLAKIPRLGLDDLEKEGKEIPIEVTDLHGSQLIYHDLFTNGIIYLDVGFNMHALPAELLPYMKLFGRALTEMGTESEDFVQMSQRIGRTTGGVWPSRSISPIHHMDGSGSAADNSAWFFLRGKSTMEQAPDLLAIMRDLLLTANLDNRERFQQMLFEAKARAEAGLIPGGHGVVAARLGSRLTVAGWAAEQMDGIDNLFFLRKLIEQVESDWPSVLAKLEKIRSLLLNRASMLCNVTLDADNWAEFQPQLAGFVETMPVKPVTLYDWSAELNPLDEGLAISAQVNYVAKGARLYDLGYRLHGSVLPISNFLRTTWLWEKVRVQGGAYGGFCQFSTRSGLFAFLSYRDPNLLDTVDVYDQTASFLRKLELNNDELIKSIIGSISAMDAYQLPDAKGFTSLTRYLLGESAEERQRLRDQVLGTTAADFRAFADVLDTVREAGSVVVLGAKDALDEANVRRGNWLQVTKVM